MGFGIALFWTLDILVMLSTSAVGKPQMNLQNSDTMNPPFPPPFNIPSPANFPPSNQPGNFNPLNPLANFPSMVSPPVNQPGSSSSNFPQILPPPSINPGGLNLPNFQSNPPQTYPPSNQPGSLSPLFNVPPNVPPAPPSGGLNSPQNIPQSYPPSGALPGGSPSYRAQPAPTQQFSSHPSAFKSKTSPLNSRPLPPPSSQRSLNSFNPKSPQRFPSRGQPVQSRNLNNPYSQNPPSSNLNNPQSQSSPPGNANDPQSQNPPPSSVNSPQSENPPPSNTNDPQSQNPPSSINDPLSEILPSSIINDPLSETPPSSIISDPPSQNPPSSDPNSNQNSVPSPGSDKSSPVSNNGSPSSGSSNANSNSHASSKQHASPRPRSGAGRKSHLPFHAVRDDNPLKDYRIVCLFNNRHYFRGGFTPSEIDPSLCTHVNYEFAILDPKSHEVMIGEPDLDVTQNFYQEVIDLRKVNPKLKVMLSLGGWADSTKKYSEMADDEQKRNNFVEKAVAFLKTHEFDGMDLAWEYPNCWQGALGAYPKDKANFVLLLKELKSAFEKESFILSVSVGAIKREVEAAYDVPAISDTVDYINVMTYDMHGPWEKVTGHHVQFEKMPNDTDPYCNVKAAMEFWVEKGANKKKLNMGLALYAKTFTLADANNNGMGAPAVGVGDPGPLSDEGGFMLYNEICPMLNGGNWTEAEDKHAGFYAYSGDQWACYDNPMMMVRKGRFVVEEGYGGVLLKDLSGDDYKGLCFSMPFPLLKMCRLEMIQRIRRQFHHQG